MATVYHYDANGKPTGSTSDEPPKPGCIATAIGIVLVIILVLCAKSDNDKGTPEPTQQEAKSQEAPDNFIKAEPNGRTVITHTVTREGSVHGDRLDANPALQDQLRKMEELKRKARARDFDENP